MRVPGSGADETIADYGFGGKKFYPHSSFGGWSAAGCLAGQGQATTAASKRPG